MNPERWQQISRIFESALRLDDEKRAAYVREHCGADESLRLDVEKLIASHRGASADGFIDSPAVEKVASLIAEGSSNETSPQLLEGRLLGAYLIEKSLGAGGMGEVYLARDTRLDRSVALKVLPEDVATDERRMQRFAHEAKVASALNQPNILTVYEFGQAESLHFLVTEYIDGETLRRRLLDGQPKLTEILDISVQIVAALEAAHEAKIVHRDIKPENVMIRRRDQIVKVLDFGLAKLTKRASETLTDTEAPTELKTTPGSLLGTVAYMSPEQSQGLLIDERSDLWSAGVVIYEMTAGRVPFKGPTPSHTIVEIIEKEAPPLSQVATVEVPDELERIVRKALAKDRSQRYQTASDLLIDLRNLRKRVDFESEIERSSPVGFSKLPGRRVEALRKEINGSIGGRKSGRSLMILGVATLVLLATGFAIRAWLKSTEGGAPSSPVASTVNSPERQLSYWMTVQKYRNGKPFEEPFQLAGEINFERDYQIRLHVRSPEGGYLYIVNESPSGASPLQILFPSTTSNSGSALIGANQVIQIPEQSWLKFDKEQGTETLWLVWSASSVAELEAVKRFANITHRGVIGEPRMSESVQSFLAKHRTDNLKVAGKDNPQETLLRSNAKIMVHAIKLAHN